MITKSLGGVMMKKSFIYLSILLAFLGIQLQADEPLHSKGHLVPVILNAGEHLLTGKSRDGKIQIENGLILKVLKSDELKVTDEWEYHEHLSITHNPYIGGGSDFYVYNINRDEFVHANLYSPPNPNNDHTKKIILIDPFDGEVVLMTRTGTKYSWRVEAKDLDIIREWEIGDHIVLGKNNHWYSSLYSDCGYIMLNCNKHPHTPCIRVKPY